MGVVFRSAGTFAEGNNSTTLQPGLPSGWQPGDLLLLFASTRLRTATASINGWDLVTSYQHTGAGGRMYVYKLIATAGLSDQNVNFANGGTNNTVMAQILAFYNTAQNTSPVLVGTWSENASAQNIGPITALQPTKSNGMILVVGHKSDNWTSVATLTGDTGVTWGEATESSSAQGSDAGHVVDYGYWTGSPPTLTNKTFTVTGGAANLAIGVMLEVVPSIYSTGSPLTQAQSATLSGTGALDHAAGEGDAALAAQSATTDGTGAVEHKGTGAGTGQAATTAGTGTVTQPAQTIYSLGSTVELVAQSSTGAGTGERESVGTGSLEAQAATASGTGEGEQVFTGDGALVADSATAAGSGTTSQPVVVYASGSTVELIAQSSTAAGTGTAQSTVVEHTGTGALVAGSATAVGGATKDVWDVGSTISLVAQQATLYTASGVVIEDIGSTAELVAQSALLSGSSKASKTAVGALAGQAAVVAGAGKPARLGTGSLVAASAQTYGVSERLVTLVNASLVAGTAQFASVASKNDVASGQMLSDPAVVASSGAVARFVSDELYAADALIEGLGGHSTANGPVGSGELYGGTASITNSSVVNKVASGTLHAEEAIVAASGTREITTVDADLEAYPAIVNVSSLAGDILTWEGDDVIWGQPAVIHARDYPVFPQGNIFYQADFGAAFDKQPVRVLLERTGLALLGRDRQGNWKMSQGVIKFVSGVWPFLKGTPGSQVLVYVGSQMHPEEAITWEGPYTAIIGETEYLDFTVSGRYIAVRFESIGQQPWELISYDLDLTTVGER